MQDRLTEIVFMLLSGQRVTAGELARRFGVSVRTVYRDVDRLSAAGIPVYTDRGNGGGIRLLEAYRLDSAYLDEGEQTQLVALLRAFEAASGGDAARLSRKLSGLFSGRADYIEVDLSDWRDDGSVMRTFDALKNAVLDKRAVRLDYRNGNGEVSARVVEPLKLIFKSRAWYLYAYCRLRGENRLFKLARIGSIEETGETFDRVCLETDIARNLSWRGDVVELTLLVDGGLKGMLVDTGQTFTVTKDGDCLVRAVFPDDDFLMSYVASFGDRAEVLEPLWLRDKAAAMLRAAANRYDRAAKKAAPTRA